MRELIAELGSLEELVRNDRSAADVEELVRRQRAIVRELRRRRSRLQREGLGPSAAT